jgi:2,3,4,5-tetrahydropyridine-2-carboxylate N-succinyltransferase
VELADRIRRSYDSGDIDHDAVHEVLDLLDRGELRVAEKQGDDWIVHDWVKLGILLYFRIAEMKQGSYGDYVYHDKIPLKTRLVEQGVRVVPPGTVRFGSFLERGCIVMPGYVNIGAYVGAGSMVDTWATVGSCAQIGKGVHLAGGVGIGGVLEPANARPVIVEDGAVLGAGTILTASTPIIDVTGETEVVHRGYVPPRSVVIPGMRTKSFPAGDYGLQAALVIGQRKASTDRKTSLNQVLREFAVQV